jgi:hypothetical protein
VQDDGYLESGALQPVGGVHPDRCGGRGDAGEGLADLVCLITDLGKHRVRGVTAPKSLYGAPILTSEFAIAAVAGTRQPLGIESSG